VIGLVVVWRALPLTLKFVFQHKYVGEILKFSGWMYGASIVSILNVRVGDSVLTSYMGTAALASYSTAMQVPSMLQKIFESIRPVILGYVSSMKLESARTAVAASRLLAGLLVIGAIILIAIAQPLMVILFSSKYQDGVPIMQALSAWMAIAIVNYYLSITLLGLGQSKRVFILSIPQFALMIAGTLLLVPFYQGIGAAAALIITAMLGNLIACWMLAEGSLDRFKALSWAHLRSIIPLLCLLIIILLIKPSFVTTTLMSIATIFSLFAFGTIAIQDLHLLYQRITMKN
jgi:O-antigen/teichoic acid export membrane protein